MNLPKSYNLKPNLVSALVLKCPYCRSNSLNKSYFVLKNLRQLPLPWPKRREEERLLERCFLAGEFSNHINPIFYTCSCFNSKTDLNEEIIAGLVACCIYFWGLNIPFSRAFYMWLDHKMKPLNQDDYEEFQRIKAKQ